MTDDLMGDLLAHASLAFEINTEPDPEAECALCGDTLDFLGDTRVVAVALKLDLPDVCRICQNCSDKRDPGMWDIATGMDEILTGLLHLAPEDREPMADRISAFIHTLATIRRVGE
ncbi:hypothetical protein GXW83_27500 [Streptacidiphilus sp. PB12-B1b]|uniref:hypothetical protein n=1 Tax=Streptacidiphilus sp. PB12-B1b TaxID=2705012 RepID=UPI0015F9F370|nr:hypothetical protein [Streptacidiphilus sp. PB12-B1b]QMU78891.1 hypothetical protein GXW83_27500 [Streptacidiphilus sp. PB12-B1b]